MNFLFVNWNPNPNMMSPGGFDIRWYGVLFAITFLSGYFIMSAIFKREKENPEKLDALTLWMVFFTFLGARLGHCLFYEPEVYLKDPIRILYLREGGLASHGAAIGIILGMWIWARRNKKSALWILDRVVILVALSGFFIRTGNLINSEIIGKPTDLPWGFVFQSADAGDQNPPWLFGEMTQGGIRVQTNWEKDAVGLPFELWKKSETDSRLLTEWKGGDKAEFLDATASKKGEHYQLIQKGETKPYASARIVARHPTQIYEAIGYLLIFIFLLFLYYKKEAGNHRGRLFGVFLVAVFGFRFLVEFFKENQVEFESSLSINMGQGLSLPFVALGIWILLRKKPLPF